MTIKKGGKAMLFDELFIKLREGELTEEACRKMFMDPDEDQKKKNNEMIFKGDPNCFIDMVQGTSEGWGWLRNMIRLALLDFFEEHPFGEYVSFNDYVEFLDACYRRCQRDGVFGKAIKAAEAIPDNLFKDNPDVGEIAGLFKKTRDRLGLSSRKYDEYWSG